MLFVWNILSSSFTYNTATIPAELEYVVASAKTRSTCNKITHNAASKYCRAVEIRVNVSKEAHDKQGKKRRTGFIKVSSLSNNREIRVIQG